MQSQKPKLLFIVADCPFFCSHRLQIAIAARNAGYDVSVACPEAPQITMLRDNGLTWENLKLSRGGLSPSSEIKSFLNIFSLMRKLRPDVTHLVASKPVIYGGIAPWLLGLPIAASISGLGYAFTAQGFRGAILKTFAKLGYGLALNHKYSRVIVQNNSDRDDLVNVRAARPESLRLIGGSGVDLSRISPSPFSKGPIVFSLPARMLRDKGVNEFAEAARLLKVRGKSAKFLLFGAPDPQNPTSIPEEKLKAWTQEGIVEWRGYARDMNAALAETHVVVLPSYREGFPKTVIDAAAAGRMSLVSDVPGCRESIVAGKTGLFCEVRNSQSLAEKMEWLCDHRNAVEQMGKNARQHAQEHFDINAVCSSTLKIYAELRTVNSKVTATNK